jgi:hypothetical protein|tara:strand:+ start:35 stop:229 length:195 start_codon:yes stop_codon:yes gene_type:complete
MANHHIKKPHVLDPEVTVYYVGNGRWTDNFDQRKKYTSKVKANAQIANTDGTNGGWTGCTIVQE